MRSYFDSESYRSQWKAVRRAKFPEELSDLPDPSTALAVPRSSQISPTSEQKAYSELRMQEALARRETVVPDHYIVSWKRESFPYSLKKDGGRSAELVHASGRTLTDVSRDLAESVGGDIYRTWNLALAGFAAVLTPEQAKALSEHPEIKAVEPDFIIKLAFEQTNLPAGLYGLDRIDEHNISTENVYRFARNGSGVHAYVIDTGLRGSHDEFQSPNRIGNGFFVEGVSTTDTNGHGTHVAGTLGGNTFGVAKGVTIHPVRVSEDGLWYASEAIECIDWVILDHEAEELAVANMSWRWYPEWLDDEEEPYYDEPVAFPQAVQNLINDGVVVVVAAGNEGEDAENCFPCAGIPDVITVGMINSSDARVWWSNDGPGVDVWAPGYQVLSAGIAHDSDENTLSGTSMAAPHVAGIAARYLQMYPTFDHFDVRDLIVNNAVTGKISGNLYGAANRLAFINGWFYPYHTFAEWGNSDIPVTSDHWFYRPELGGWVWTSDIYYDTYDGWFYRHSDTTWLQLWATTPWVTFYNQSTGHLEIYQE